MNLILLGMPGAGKGTQAEFIQKDYGLANISTGAMMREVSRSNSELATRVQSYLSSGTLVPNEIIIEMLVERIQKEDLVLYLSIKEEEIISRMSGRRVHLASGRSYHILHNPPKKDGFDDVTGEALIQREDDNPEVIKKRLSVYYNETEPLLEFYKNKDLKFIEIDASKSVDVVTDSIRQSIST
jgi:adenylate kinase